MLELYRPLTKIQNFTGGKGGDARKVGSFFRKHLGGVTGGVEISENIWVGQTKVLSLKGGKWVFHPPPENFSKFEPRPPALAFANSHMYGDRFKLCWIPLVGKFPNSCPFNEGRGNATK